jgi:uncharacterized protein (TIGR02300 family)
MATKAERGTKRTCQNPECGVRFYDLNRAPIVCPICKSIYELASAPEAGLPAAPSEEKPRKVKKPEIVADEDRAGAELPLADEEGALADVEAEEDTIVTDEQESFIEEEEEDGGHVSGILGVTEDEEEA